VRLRGAFVNASTASRAYGLVQFSKFSLSTLYLSPYGLILPVPATRLAGCRLCAELDNTIRYYFEANLATLCYTLSVIIL